jgi:hypothetical protein
MIRLSSEGDLWLGACSGYNRSTSRSAYIRITEKNATKKERITRKIPRFPATSRESQSTILLPMIWDDASETYANLGWVGEGEGARRARYRRNRRDRT